MSSHFAYFSASRDELIELHRALLRQLVLENTLRREQGLETVDQTTILNKLEQLLNISGEEAHTLMHQTEDELWEYSWYTYTDEWAWYRAKQAVAKQLGKAITDKTLEELDQLAEVQYEKSFDTYVAEIDMQTDTQPKLADKKRVRTPKKK